MTGGAAGEAEVLGEADLPALIVLWQAAGLTRPWNDPEADARRAMAGPASAILGMRGADGALVATVMVGVDGHRGWVYYLAVTEGHRGQGMGRAMMDAAQVWALAHGAPKLQLMVRDTNTEAAGFYEALGYAREPVAVFSRWLAKGLVKPLPPTP